MQQSLWERFIEWVCTVFGHKPADGEFDEWIHDGKLHRICKRCHYIYSVPVDKEQESE